MLNWLLLIIGIALLIKGADLFVDGASAIARKLKVPSLIIGLTLVSIGTSMPEASISVNAALNNMNDMSISNVVGSNLFNTFAMLGISAIIFPLAFKNEVKKYDIPIMVGLYCLLLIFSFVITPFKITRLEGVIFLLLLISYISFLILRAKKYPLVEEEHKKEEINILLSICYSIIGLVTIILGGNVVVDSASKIAISLGMSETLVGLTIVAIGTSLPELVTSIVAISKKENDLSIGNAIGSNIFNIIFILGATSTISGLALSNEAIVDLTIMLSSGLILLLVAYTSKELKRWHGITFVLLYVSYIAFCIIRNYML
jgi:cation:H+ antiporter